MFHFDNEKRVCSFIKQSRTYHINVKTYNVRCMMNLKPNIYSPW